FAKFFFWPDSTFPTSIFLMTKVTWKISVATEKFDGNNIFFSLIMFTTCFFVYCAVYNKLINLHEITPRIVYLGFSIQPINSYKFTKISLLITTLPFTTGGRFPRAWLEPPRKKPTSCGGSRLPLFP